MPKIQKTAKTESSLQERKMEIGVLKNRMIKSSLNTYIYALVCFIVSFLFNARFVSLPGDSQTISILNTSLKVVPIILFFLFGMVSIGNYREYRGYIVSWKEMLLLIVVSLFQGSSEAVVFFIALLGIVLVLVYIYFIQGKIE